MTKYYRDFPITSGAFQANYAGAPSCGPGDAFVSKLNSSGSEDNLNKRGDLLLKKNTVQVTFPYIKRPTSGVSLSAMQDGRQPRPSVTMTFLHSNAAPEIVEFARLPGTSNYFRGSDPNQWHAAVPHFSRVRYQGLYHGIDAEFYGDRQDLEFDLVVQAGTSPKAVELQFTGPSHITVEHATGDLVAIVAGKSIHIRKPIAYQLLKDHDGKDDRVAVACAYQLDAWNRVQFKLGHYDRTKALIIDPTLLFSTYLGGTSEDESYGMVVDQSGNIYMTGTTNSDNFPVTPGAFSTVCSHGVNGCYDAFVTKMSSDGQTLLYSTFLGGGDGSGVDEGRSIAVDATGNAYITGFTTATNFPTTAGAFQTRCGGGCIGNGFIAKLSSDGSSLVYSTYLGGSSEDVTTAIAVDSSGDAFVTGEANSYDFPVTAGAYKTVCGCNDAFVTKLNTTGTALVYSTFLGGDSNADGGSAIVVDTQGYAYVAGLTASTDFPVLNAFQPAFGGGDWDGFVTKVGIDGSSLVYSTYLGGSADDELFAATLDGSGNIYLTGSTCSSNFPTTPGAFQTTYAGGDCSYGGDVFVTKLGSSGNALVYSTFLGGSDDDEALGIALDSSNDVFVTGRTHSTNFPTLNPIQSSNGGGFDAFATELDATGSVLLFSTYVGGTDPDVITAPAIDSTGNLILFGFTYSANFPIQNAYQPVLAGGGDVVILKLSLNAGTGPAIYVSPSTLNYGLEGLRTTSAYQTITLTNTGGSTVTFSSITLTGANAKDYVMTNYCGSSLSASLSCTLQVAFGPTSRGIRTAAISIIDNAPASPQTVSLSGSGNANRLSAASLDFKTVAVGSSSLLPVTLTNLGGQSTLIGQVRITGLNKSDYSQTNDCGKSLAAKASCEFTVTFSPRFKGTRTADLQFTSTGTGMNSVTTVLLTGKAK